MTLLQEVPVPASAEAGAAPPPRARPRDRRRWRPHLRRALPLLLAAGVLAPGSLLVHVESGKSRDALLQRFEERAGLTADSVARHAHTLLQRERVAAESVLAEPQVDAATFRAVAAGLGVQAAVLLDDSGQLLAAHPPRDVPLGTPIAQDYAHLAAAVRGRPAISDLVVAAGSTTTLVAFAVPYETRSGRRVLSGAYDVATSHLQAFVTEVLPVAGTRAYLVDDRQRVVTASTSTTDAGQPLAELDPRLAAAEAAGRTSYDGRALQTRRVEGTPWRLLVTVPEQGLYAPLRSQSHVLWLIVGCLALVAGAAGRLYLRLAGTRDRLADAALVDHLTGLGNRRYVATELETALAAAQAREEPMSVLLVDVDHFKRVNDTFGHDAGDRALRHVADALRAELRSGDVIGRWGGEEFLVLLPGTGAGAAREVSERLRDRVALMPLLLGSGGDRIQLTVSVGGTTTLGEPSAVVVHRADRALYRAKRQGRNRTVVA